MNPLRASTRAVFAVAAVAAAALSFAGDWEGEAPEPRADASLVAATTAAARGGAVTVAVRFEPGPGTHLYWRNPGDAGMAPILRWTLPEGVTAGEIRWPVPRRFESGGIVGFGYEEPFLLSAEVRVPADYSGTSLPLRVEVEWLACTDICVGGEASLVLDLPVGAGPAPEDPRWTALFGTHRASLPGAAPEGALSASGSADGIRLAVKGLPAAARGPWFFPDVHDVVAMDGVQTWTAAAGDGGTGALRLPLAARREDPPARLAGVLAWDTAEGRRGWKVDVPVAIGETR